MHAEHAHLSGRNRRSAKTHVHPSPGFFAQYFDYTPEVDTGAVAKLALQVRVCDGESDSLSMRYDNFVGNLTLHNHLIIMFCETKFFDYTPEVDTGAVVKLVLQVPALDTEGCNTFRLNKRPESGLDCPFVPNLLGSSCRASFSPTTFVEPYTRLEQGACSYIRGTPVHA